MLMPPRSLQILWAYARVSQQQTPSLKRHCALGILFLKNFLLSPLLLLLFAFSIIKSPNRALRLAHIWRASQMLQLSNFQLVRTLKTSACKKMFFEKGNKPSSILLESQLLGLQQTKAIWQFPLIQRKRKGEGEKKIYTSLPNNFHNPSVKSRRLKGQDGRKGFGL